MEEAIAEIVDAFCPPGILDEEAARVAIAEALLEALGDAPTFDPAAVNDQTIVVATTCFVAELVFASVITEQGAMASDVSPTLAMRRENSLRELVREATDHIATPMIQQEGAALDPARLNSIVIEIASAVYRELAQWPD